MRQQLTLTFGNKTELMGIYMRGVGRSANWSKSGIKATLPRASYSRPDKLSRRGLAVLNELATRLANRSAGRCAEHDAAPFLLFFTTLRASKWPCKPD
jgi:hypothetical protein